jgi:hypothetical protein
MSSVYGKPLVYVSWNLDKGGGQQRDLNRHIIVKMLKANDKEKILKAVREK